MGLNSRAAWLAVAVALSWVACSGAGTQGTLGPTGGELCLDVELDGGTAQVCLLVPPGSLPQQELIRIAPTAVVPEGALSPGFDIGEASGRPLRLLSPATVRFSLDLVSLEGIENENILRLSTLDLSDGGAVGWRPLERAFVDRVRNVVTGQTQHLSPFVVLRADRLPDGGLPLELDGGQRDGSVVAIPPFDAGRPDAGRPDAGTPDAGRPDAGGPDAGTPDGGRPDAGMPDAGTPDAGAADAGAPDGGLDAGEDAGVDDAGADAG